MVPDALFKVFGQGVYLYGICIALGLVACLTIFYTYTKKADMPESVQDFVFFVLIGGLAVGFLFAMLFQAFYNYLEDGVFVFGSGMTVMGGLIGGAGAFLLLYFVIGKFYFTGKKENLHKIHFNTVFRVAPICICVAHAFGRIGCLMSGCCHGEYLGQEYVFGGVWMEGTVNGFSKWGYYVPTQLYESLFLFALTAVLSVLYFKRSNILMQIYLISYGVWRIIIEIFRADERGAIILGLAPSQWQSILFIVGGIALLVIYYVKKWQFILPPKESIVKESIEKKEDVDTSNE